MQARRRAEERLGPRSADSTGTTFPVQIPPVGELSRQIASLEDATAAHARLARLEVELRHSETRERGLQAEVTEMGAELTASRAEVFALRSELQEQARDDVRLLQAELRDAKGRRTPERWELEGPQMRRSPSKERVSSATHREYLPEVQRLEDVVRQHQTKLPVKLDRDAARSVAALDAELEELDGQFHLAEAARHASTRAQLLLREADLLQEMESLGVQHERLRASMEQALVDMQACEAEAQACLARGAQHRKLSDEAAEAQRALRRRQKPRHDSPTFESHDR